MTEVSGDGYRQAVMEFLPAVVRKRASLQPHDTAYTFVDYDKDWAGVEKA